MQFESSTNRIALLVLIIKIPGVVSSKIINELLSDDNTWSWIVMQKT